VCGTVGLFLGCEVAATCPLQRLAGEAEPDAPYRSPFDSWDERAAVRSAPRRILARPLPPDPFPPELVPVFRHELVRSISGRARTVLLAHHLYRYLDFTAQLELLVVNETLVDLALRSSTGLDEAMRLDALRMVCDESYHGLFSIDMKLQLARAYRVPPAADTQAWFLRRLDHLLAGLATSQRGLAKLLFVTVSETLISASLAEHTRSESAPAAVRDMLQDHAVDEGRHHAFFAAFARYLWSRLGPGERQWAGRLLPQLIDVFFTIDTAAIEADLVAAALTESDARRVVEETFGSDEVAAQKRAAASRTLRYFDELGAFRDGAAQDEIVRYGLAEP